MCHVLQVSRAAYYAWHGRPESPRAARVSGLAATIRQLHHESRGAYGSPRVFRDLEARGVACCERTVAKLMRRQGLRGANARRSVVHTTDSRHGHAIAENALDRRFEPGEPDRTWVADITYVATAEGWLYLAAVLDLGTRQVVGWATADHLRSELAERALSNALEHRRPTGPVLHHSDRGVQYACDAYQELLRANGFGGEHEPQGELPRQRGDGELLRDAEAGVGASRDLSDTRGGEGVAVRVHRGVLQSPAAPLVAGLPGTRPVRRESETFPSRRPLFVRKARTRPGPGWVRVGK